jgi:hypothetical protein
VAVGGFEGCPDVDSPAPVVVAVWVLVAMLAGRVILVRVGVRTSAEMGAVRMDWSVIVSSTISGSLAEWSSVRLSGVSKTSVMRGNSAGEGVVVSNWAISSLIPPR